MPVASWEKKIKREGIIEINVKLKLVIVEKQRTPGSCHNSLYKNLQKPKFSPIFAWVIEKLRGKKTKQNQIKTSSIPFHGKWHSSSNYHNGCYLYKLPAQLPTHEQASIHWLIIGYFSKTCNRINLMINQLFGKIPLFIRTQKH